MYVVQSLPFLSKCALENGFQVLLGCAVSKNFKTPYFTPIGSHCATPDKGRLNHRTLVLWFWRSKRFAVFHVGALLEGHRTVEMMQMFTTFRNT